jgi:hypothetical protein
LFEDYDESRKRQEIGMLKHKSTSDGLIGMWLHTYDEDGEISQQLQVIRRSGDVYLCQVYSWQNGSPTICVAIARNRILGLKLYETFEAMDTALVKHLRQQKIQQGAASSSPALSVVA